MDSTHDDAAPAAQPQAPLQLVEGTKMERLTSRKPNVSMADGGSESGFSSPGPGVQDGASPSNPDASSATSLTPACPSSWSMSSDRQLGHSSQQNPGDRVFPIRSVICVELTGRTSSGGELEYFSRAKSTISETSSAPTALPRSIKTRLEPDEVKRRRTSLSTDNGPFSPPPAASPSDRLRQRRKNAPTGSLSRVQADAQRYGSNSPFSLHLDDSSDHESDPSSAKQGRLGDGGMGSSRRTSLDEAEAVPDPESLYSHRFKHVVMDEGHAVITGRDGTLQRCEDEPIHAPGAVQSFGLLLALREEEDGALSVRYVSENSQRLLGYTPQELFKLHSFLDVLTEEQADNLLDHIDFIRDEEADPAVNGPDVFSVSIRPPKRRAVKLWCAVHINTAHPHLVICEFELDDDIEYPLRPVGEATPETPQDTLQGNPTTEELTESTETLSRPLRVLRSARKRRGESGAMQVFDIMSQVQEQLGSAPNLETFLKILVGIVKELTGFHRVMIYQFDQFFNGKVVTELVDTAATRDLYKGLHFPASDIPRQARDLYRVNKVRLLYDRDLETARIVCRSVEDLALPLDMTHSYLRAMSPIHLKYLANMAVRSSMSISINAFDELWGLIACHSYGTKGMRVSFPIRKMCRLVGDTASRNIERLSFASRLQARKLINTAPTDKNPSGYIIASSDDLLNLFDADCGMLSIRGETKCLGKMDHIQEALAMLEYLRLRKFTAVLTSQDITVDFPDLRYLPGFRCIAGLLYVPLSEGGNDFIVFIRRGQIKSVKWAGNPYDKVIKEGTSEYLEPRKSFKVWHETVVGKCRDWSEEQVETAAVLCLVYGKFIEVWRQKEAALQSSRLTRLLLANSAHEVRTPLNAIINYLEVALEGSLDQETRENLAKSHSASKSLIYVINDLLDLTKTEQGQELVKDEVFDFPACIREATEAFRNDAKRKDIAYEVVEHPGLPRLVVGDQRRVRQAVANLTANAVQHTNQGFVRVELYVVEVQDCHVRVEIVVQDSGSGMSNVQLDHLFRELEQVSSDVDDNSLPTNDEKPTNTKTLGLGLAVVARTVRNMDGQLRLKSEEGEGSRFVVQLRFDLAPEDMSAHGGETADTAGMTPITSSAASVTSHLPAMRDGEMMLVDRGAVAAAVVANHQPAVRSPDMTMFDDAGSMKSHLSGASKTSVGSGLSDADRLIDAIQTPLTLGDPEVDSTAAIQRKNSRGAHTGGNRAVMEGSHHLTRTSSASSRVARPESPSRSLSSPGHAHFSDPSRSGMPGMAFVTGSKTPVTPVRVPCVYLDMPSPAQPSSGTAMGILLEVEDKHDTSCPTALETSSVSEPTSPALVKLKVLIAEDDPINLKILRKRLEKAGHKVFQAVNGQDCATVYSEEPEAYDVILMDMQMPIVDGLGSTKMIRRFEQTRQHTGLSSLATRLGRVPIVAVSASLVERDKDMYVNAGFDAWILKPVDFKRLETLLLGLLDDSVRNKAVYTPGQWECGGWFRRRTDLPAKNRANTAPLSSHHHHHHQPPSYGARGGPGAEWRDRGTG